MSNIRIKIYELAIVTEALQTFEMLNHHESLLALDATQGQRALKK
jgi:signal recognition particle GTPase